VPSVDDAPNCTPGTSYVKRLWRALQCCKINPVRILGSHRCCLLVGDLWSGLGELFLALAQSVFGIHVMLDGLACQVLSLETG
jgi:hypothetical protein